MAVYQRKTLEWCIVYSVKFGTLTIPITIYSYYFSTASPQIARADISATMLMAQIFSPFSAYPKGQNALGINRDIWASRLILKGNAVLHRPFYRYFTIPLRLRHALVELNFTLLILTVPHTHTHTHTRIQTNRVTPVILVTLDIEVWTVNEVRRERTVNAVR